MAKYTEVKRKMTQEQRQEAQSDIEPFCTPLGRTSTVFESTRAEKILSALEHKYVIIPRERTTTMSDTDNLSAIVNRHLPVGLGAARLSVIAAQITDQYILVDRAGLPVVYERDGWLCANATDPNAPDPFIMFTRDRTPAGLRSCAAAYLALAQWAEDHPPVDQAQVDALADLLREDGSLRGVANDDVARHLVERGVTVAGVES